MSKLEPKRGDILKCIKEISSGCFKSPITINKEYVVYQDDFICDGDIYIVDDNNANNRFEKWTEFFELNNKCKDDFHDDHNTDNRKDSFEFKIFHADDYDIDTNLYSGEPVEYILDIDLVNRCENKENLISLSGGKTYIVNSIVSYFGLDEEVCGKQIEFEYDREKYFAIMEEEFFNKCFNLSEEPNPYIANDDNNPNIPSLEPKDITDSLREDDCTNDGKKTNYYQLSFAPFEIKDADDFAEWREMNFFQGNILKAAWTFNVGRHSGTDALRDINKIIHYAERERDRLLKLKEKE